MAQVTRSELLDFCTLYTDRAADASESGVQNEDLNAEFLSIKLPKNLLQSLLSPGDEGDAVVGLMGLFGIHEYVDNGQNKKATTITLIPCKQDASGEWKYRQTGGSNAVGEQRWSGDEASILEKLVGDGSQTTEDNISDYLTNTLGLQ